MIPIAQFFAVIFYVTAAGVAALPFARRVKAPVTAVVIALLLGIGAHATALAGLTREAGAASLTGLTARPQLSVRQGVIADVVRAAALEVKGVARVSRGGPAWRRAMGGRPVSVRVREDRVVVRLWIVARPGYALGPLAGSVRTAVSTAVERLLGLDVGAVTILVDGVGS